MKLQNFCQHPAFGFVAEPGSGGILLIPSVNGKPLPDSEAHLIPIEEQNEILKKRQILEAYPIGTVNGLIHAKLKNFAASVKEIGIPSSPF